MNFTKFDNDTLCIKWLDLSFMNITRLSDSGCGSGLKICGGGQDKDFKVCVPSSM